MTVHLWTDYRLSLSIFIPWDRPLLVLFDRLVWWMTAQDLIHSDRPVEHPQTGYFDRSRLLIQILFPMDKNIFSLDTSG